MNSAVLSKVTILAFMLGVSGYSPAAERTPESPGDTMIAEYFKAETGRLRDATLAEIKTLEDWNFKKELYRRQLFEMLSLSPLPERTDLNATITGKIREDAFTVEKVHFQTMPGLYVTGNLYLPNELHGPAPAILYVCGHARVVKDGVSYGNKTGYQHHGAWFARNGYVCLTIDTIQLGEIAGVHHGTHREGFWWWNSRGYTPAGVEAWNGIRALDYLQSRPEVDPNRIGVTGRSGGGAYSWWLVALDERVKAAAPVAGITDLENHVVDGVVEGHCDCMFVVNTYRWDYAQVAALAAPRPLLIANSDKDYIFPLDGVVRVHEQVRRIYELHNAANHLGLLITEGPHKDTQDLQLPVFRWFNRFLKQEDPLIEMAATKFFDPEELKVFETLPADERTSTIHESFVPVAGSPSIPSSAAEWNKARNEWSEVLDEKVFRGWPSNIPPSKVELKWRAANQNGEIELHEFTSQEAIRLPVVVLRPSGNPTRIVFEVVDDTGWNQWKERFESAFPGFVHSQNSSAKTGDVAGSSNGDTSWQRTLDQTNTVHVVFPPRGIGPTRWNQTERKQVQIRRRFMLLGQTLDGMRVWDIRRALTAVGEITELSDLPIHVKAHDQMAVNALYAAVYEADISELRLTGLPASHRKGPDYLNVLRFLDIPQVVAMVSERVPVLLSQTDASAWKYPTGVARALAWNSRQLRLED